MQLSTLSWVVAEVLLPEVPEVLVVIWRQLETWHRELRML